MTARILNFLVRNGKPAHVSPPELTAYAKERKAEDALREAEDRERRAEEADRAGVFIAIVVLGLCYLTWR